jgi:sec-independent protein translocase protein TatC
MTVEQVVSEPAPERAPEVDPDKASIDASRAPLLEHLVELRRRLLWSFGALFIGFIVCFNFAREIFAFLVQPLLAEGQGMLVYTQLFEAFFVELKVALFAAVFISFPVFATQIWRFVAPGLYRNERRALLPFLLATPVLFIAGASAAYYGAIPIALRFLLGFQGNVGGVEQEALPGVGNYLDFVMHFVLAFGIAFLLPILLMLLERAGIVTLTQLRASRRYMIVAAFVIAAIFTPPDVVSQLLLAIPLIILFEAALLAIALTSRKAPPAVTDGAAP